MATSISFHEVTMVTTRVVPSTDGSTWTELTIHMDDGTKEDITLFHTRRDNVTILEDGDE